MSVNDVRRKENMSPVEGGDIYRFPLNTTTLEHASAAAEAAVEKAAQGLPAPAGGEVGSQTESNHGEGKSPSQTQTQPGSDDGSTEQTN
jgi:hypothetical protein